MRHIRMMNKYGVSPYGLSDGGAGVKELFPGFARKMGKAQINKSAMRMVKENFPCFYYS